MSLRLIVGLVTIGASAAACAPPPKKVLIVYTEGGSAIPLRLFPELPTSGTVHRWPSPSVPPSVDAVPCAETEPSAPDTIWPALRAPARSQTIGAITLRLPPTFVVEPFVGAVPENAEARGGVLVGTWSDTTGGVERVPSTATRIAAWIGVTPGYHAVFADTATRQVNAVECISTTPVRGTHVLTFTLVLPDGTSHEYLTAVLPVAPERYVQIEAFATRPEALRTVRRSLMSAIIEPPRR